MDLIEERGRKLPATYLGDAVYAIYDGYSYILRLNDHRNKEGQIVMEPQVLTKFSSFVEECQLWRKQVEESAKRKESENLASTNNPQEG